MRILYLKPINICNKNRSIGGKNGWIVNTEGSKDYLKSIEKHAQNLLQSEESF